MDKRDKQVLAWLEEPDEDEEEIENPDLRIDRIESDAESEHSEHCTDTEQSSSDNEEGEISSSQSRHSLYYLGKDNITKWNYHPQRTNVRTRSHNIVDKRPGVKSVAKDAKDIVECFHVFVTEEMLTKIVMYTNIHIEKIKDRFARDRDCKETDIIEIKAFIGLLYMAGIKKMNHLNLKEMWVDDGTAPDIFRAVMNRNRFLFLMRCIRFDDIQTRQERSEFDNIAPIREMFDLFVEKCRANYQVGENVTIDEMLESFRGRCKFRMYIANKPAKYGIKVYALCDSKSFYTSNLEIYPGKQPNGPYKYDNSASAVVLRLSEDILNSGRNITADNYFTSIPLADTLLTKRTTLVGTIRKNKREIPPLFLNTRLRPKPSSIFGFHEGKVLVSYIPNKKTKKNVLMISTLHDDGRIDNDTGDEAKPEIITFYNITKGGVDVVDRLKEEYSVARVSCRWPLRLFFSILNITGINSQIIYQANTNILDARREYLKNLSLKLTQPHINRRSALQNISYPLKQIIARFSDEKDIVNTETPAGICSICPRRKNRKTKKACVYCKKFLCSEHANILCDMCKARLYDDD